MRWLGRHAHLAMPCGVAGAGSHGLAQGPRAGAASSELASGVSAIGESAAVASRGSGDTTRHFSVAETVIGVGDPLAVSAERVTAGVQVERLRAAGGVEEWRTRGEGPRPDATFDSDHSSCWVACWPRTGLTMVTVVTVVLQSHDRRAWGDSFVAFTTSTHQTTARDPHEGDGGRRGVPVLGRYSQVRSRSRM